MSQIILHCLAIESLGYNLGLFSDAHFLRPISNKELKARADSLKTFKIRIPYYAFIKENAIFNLYREAVYSCVYGLSNASVPMSFKCLEISLKIKYKELTGKEFKGKVNELIDFLGDKFSKLGATSVDEGYNKIAGLFNASGDANSLRLLRNMLHENYLYSDKEAIEMLSYASDIICKIFPTNSVIPCSVKCNFCGQKHDFSINFDECLCSEREISCRPSNYRQKPKIVIMP